MTTVLVVICVFGFYDYERGARGDKIKRGDKHHGSQKGFHLGLSDCGMVTVVWPFCIHAVFDKEMLR